MTDVVIICTQKDAAKARALAEQLELKGLRVSWLVETVAATTEVDARLRQMIDTAGAVVVIWSPHAIVSQWIMTEANYTSQGGKTVFSVVARGLNAARIPAPFGSQRLFSIEHETAVLADLLAMQAGKPGPHGFGATPGSEPPFQAALELQDELMVELEPLA